jgi:hypothetical protein
MRSCSSALNRTSKGLIFEEERRQYLFLLDFTAFFQTNSWHSDDHYIHKDLQSRYRHVPHARLQPCHYTSPPDLIMFSREIWVHIPLGMEQRMLLNLIHNIAVFPQTSFLYHLYKWNNCSSVDITVTKLQAGCSRNRGSIPNKERELLFSKMSRPANAAHPASHRVLPGPKADHLHQPRAKVTN